MARAMSKKATPKVHVGSAVLRTAVGRLEGRVEALSAKCSELSARLDKLEVVRTPSPTTTEPEEPQRPETE